MAKRKKMITGSLKAALGDSLNFIDYFESLLLPQ